MSMNRQQFLKMMGCTMAGGVVLPSLVGGCAAGATDTKFKISLAQWSLHRTFRNELGDFGGDEDPINFAKIARQEYDIDAIEYVNTFYFESVDQEGYLNELKNVAEGEGVRSVLIMCDGEGALGDPEEAARQEAVENHYRWVEAAEYLGCHSIRVNAQSSGSYEEQQELAADGLHRLSEFAADYDINVLVENHGGLSSNGEWLAGVMEMVDHPRCGTLPDFGNFRISEEEEYDKYRGVEELMPYAKSVSAKSHEFDDEGNEANIDYDRMMDIVLSAGYSGYVGIEYEGSELSEDEGIKATKALLERYQ